MIHKQLKIGKQAIALAIFICSQLTSCNCGDNNSDDLKSPETNNNTNNGGTNPGNSNNTGGSTSEKSNNTGESTSEKSNNTGESTSEKSNNTGKSTSEKSNTANTSITSEKIEKLLQELEDVNNTIDETDRVRLIKFLKKENALKKEDTDESISEPYRQMFLLSAIRYKTPQYNTTDILKLAIAEAKEVINTPYKGKTFLQYAAEYDNTEATELLTEAIDEIAKEIAKAEKE